MIKRHPKFPAGETNQYRTDPNDIPEGSGFNDWNKERIRRWAETIGPATETVIDRFEKERIERSSEIALCQVASPRYRHLNSILSSGKDKEKSKRALEKAVAARGILKGRDYFERFEGGGND